MGDRPDIYELVWRLFKKTLIHDASFVFRTDEPIDLRWKKGAVDPVLLRNSTYYFRPSENCFLREGFPLPEQGGVLFKRNHDSYMRIFMDDLFLCPDCGAFHPIRRIGTDLAWVDGMHRRIDTVAMFEAIERRKHTKEFGIRLCEYRKGCAETARRFQEEFERETEKEREHLAWTVKLKEIEQQTLVPPISAENVPQPHHQPQPEQCVYLIGREGYVKIGIATNIRKRLSFLQTSFPSRLSLLKQWTCTDAGTKERTLHAKYAEFRYSGEWFRFPDEILNRLLAVEDLDAFLD